MIRSGTNSIIRRAKQEIANRPPVVAPQIVKAKGCPRKKRLASAVERANNFLKRSCDKYEGLGDASQVDVEPAKVPRLDQAAEMQGGRRCGKCRGFGHYTTTCDRQVRP